MPICVAGCVVSLTVYSGGGGGGGLLQMHDINSRTIWRDLQETKEDKYQLLGTRRNGHHFADVILKCIFLNKNVLGFHCRCSLFPKVRMNNPAFVQIKTGDKPLSVIRNEDGLVYWRIYVSRGFNYLQMHPTLATIMHPASFITIHPVICIIIQY